MRLPPQIRALLASSLAGAGLQLTDDTWADAIIVGVWLLGGLVDYLATAPDADKNGVPDTLDTLARARGIDTRELAAWLRTVGEADLLLDALRRHVGGRVP